MKKSKKKILTKSDIEDSAFAKIFEVRKTELNKRIPPPPPSYQKRKVEAREKRKAKLKVPPALKKSLKKFGAQGSISSERHGGYYTARAAKALLALGANPKASYSKKEVPQTISFKALRGGWYSMTSGEKTLPKKFRWKEVERLQRKQNRDTKINMVAARIGAKPSEVRAILKGIEREERAKVRRFKSTKKYRGMKSKQKKFITGKRRVAAVFGAMTDLLQVYGSPKALREGHGSANWKRIGGHWAVKEGKAWLRKTGPDSWEQIKTRSRKKKK